MEMSTKKGFTIPRFTAFAVAHLAVYMGLFTLFYRLYAAEASNADWRLYLMVALLAGVFCSVMPKLAFGKLGQFAFMGIVSPVVLYALGYAVFAVYTWSLPAMNDTLGSFALVYLCIAPLSSLLVQFLAKQVAE